MLIQTIPLSQIRPATYNPRKDLKPGDAEYDKLKRSLAEFDCVEPLVWNKRTNNLVGGHQRLKILKERGDKEVEVSVVDLDEVKEKALNIALNKISGDWDLPKLNDLLADLDGKLDLLLTGFDLPEIAKLKTQLHVPGEGLTDDDAIPEQVETVCKKGDLWKLGEHRLLCGDATVITDVERLMGGEKADMVLTDPPYGVNYDSAWRKPYSCGEYSVGKIANDDKANWGAVWPMFFSPVIYCWHSGIHGAEVANGLTSAGYSIRAEIIWNKSVMVFGRGHYHWKHEPCYYAVKEGSDASWIGDHSQTTVWDYANNSGAARSGDKADEFHANHISQKPVGLLEMALCNHSCKVIADPFGGSGSTLIACEKLSRKCYMMEISEMYCDVIRSRWEAYTGKQAELLNG